MTRAALIWCPFPDEAAAVAAIGVLLDEGLVACGNVLPPMTSLFVWKGRRDTASEAGALLKTEASLLDHAILRLSQIHPYEDPAITGWRCDSAAPATLEWLSQLAPPPPGTS